jgi:hypothetical protein
MIVRRNPTDNAMLLRLERHAECCGECGKTLKAGTLAWSYMPNPVTGNYVECGPCRYGKEPQVNVT